MCQKNIPFTEKYIYKEKINQNIPGTKLGLLRVAITHSQMASPAGS